MPGSLIKKGDNKWELRVSLGYDKDTKKQIRKTKLVHGDRKTAEKLLAQFYLETIDSPSETKKYKFSEFVECYVARHDSTLAKSTQIAHDKYLRLRILPAFGHRYINEITGQDISNFLNSFSNPYIRLSEFRRNEGALKTNTVRGYAKFLHSLFNKAVKWGFITSNPFDAIDLKDIPAYNGKLGHYPIWGKSDLLKFIRILDAMSDRYFTLKNKLMFYLVLNTGLRRGEVYGLTWDKINFDEKSILIDQALKTSSFGKLLEFGKPKTTSSIRTVFFDDKTMSLLLKYKEAQEKRLAANNAVNKLNLLFVAVHYTENHETMPANGDTFSNWLDIQARRYGLPHISMHGVRAMCATYSLLAGMPITLVRSMLGHASISTTNIYTRDVLEERKEYRSAITDNIVNPDTHEDEDPQ